MNVARDLGWGGNRSLVLLCLKRLLAVMKGTLCVCAAVAAAIVPGPNGFPLGFSYEFCNGCLFMLCASLYALVESLAANRCMMAA